MAKYLLASLIILSCAVSVFGSSFILLDRQELVDSAQAVVVGRVLSIRTASDESSNLNTFIAVQVEQDFLSALAPDATIYIQERGGRYAGLAGWAFGTPEFAVGERVALFLRLRPGGLFQVAHMFQGKFRVLDGGLLSTENPDDVLIIGDDTRPFQTLAEIEAACDGRPASQPLRGFVTAPELLLAEELADFSFRGLSDVAARSRKGDSSGPKYYTLAGGGVRWKEFDTAGSVNYFYNPSSSPLDSATTASAVNAALSAWNNVSGARIALVNAGQTGLSGRDNADNVNVISFGDPQGIVPDLSGCSGTLAIAYFSYFPNCQVVNGVTFGCLVDADIVFNNGVGCALSTLDRLSEVMGHEVGHTIGFGHSSENPSEGNPLLSDALMYYRARLDGRGASVRADDIAAA